MEHLRHLGGGAAPGARPSHGQRGGNAERREGEVAPPLADPGIEIETERVVALREGRQLIGRGLAPFRAGRRGGRTWRPRGSTQRSRKTQRSRTEHQGGPLAAPGGEADRTRSRRRTGREEGPISERLESRVPCTEQETRRSNFSRTDPFRRLAGGSLRAWRHLQRGEVMAAILAMNSMAVMVCSVFSLRASGVLGYVIGLPIVAA